MTTQPPPTTETTAQMELESARSEVMSAEKDVVTIKKALRALDVAAAAAASTPSTTATTSDENETEEDGGDGDVDENSLKVYATKVNGLPANFKPTIHLQLSSPIESQTITSLYDPLDTTKEGSIATFRGVEIDVATLELRLEDTDRITSGCNDVDGNDALVGRSAVYPVIPMCDIDFLGGGVKRKSTELTVAIVADDDAGVGSSSISVSKKEEETIAETDGNDETTETEAVVEEETNTETAETDESTTESEVVVEEETNTEIVQNDETPTKSEATVDDDDVFQDAISKEENTTISSNEKETELSDSKSEEVDAVLVPSASVVKEEEVKDDVIPPSLQEKATATSTTEAVEEETTSTPTTTKSPSTLLLSPTCTIDIRVEFNPSPVGEKEALYDLLNKASRKKAQAINRLRKAAEEMNRSRQSTGDTNSTTMVTKSDAAVKKGFLNKPAKKEPMVLVRWYRKFLGPSSMARVVFPVAKNYLLFFGGLFAMHFQGHQLALPPPV